MALRGRSRVLERRRKDGTLVMAVDHDPDARLSGRRATQRAPPGRAGRASILSAFPTVAPWRWQRLLFAQVLPLAATLQGLELLHASAVELEGQALGFVAPSGTGKTSVAAHVVAAAWNLLTDDVLAVEADAAERLVTPGCRGSRSIRGNRPDAPATGGVGSGERLGRADGKDLFAIELA